MKINGIKLKNRRIYVRIRENKLDNQDSILVVFKRLAKDDNEVDEFINNPTCKMEINKRIVTTKIELSIEGAHNLICLLKKTIYEYENK